MDFMMQLSLQHLTALGFGILMKLCRSHLDLSCRKMKFRRIF